MTALLVLAGVAAGLIGSAGGITSLVSYPALLGAGLSPISASIANNVALVGCLPGSALASRPELRGRSGWLWRWATIALAGGAGGSVLLLLTPPGLFAHIVPCLVAAGSVALAFEPRLNLWRRGRARTSHGLSLPAGLLMLSFYNGYFGAGAGVMTLVLMLILVDGRLLRANALKNVLIGAASVASATVFTLWGPVDWAAAVPLALGMFAGSRLGPPAARHIPPGFLRGAIVLLGGGLAVYLWLDPRS